jgi:hypothetical protein
VYQNAVVPSGQQRVFYLAIPSGSVGFIRSLYCNWYQNTEVHLYIDGEDVEKITRQIGSINEPLQYSPPWAVRRSIEFVAFNNTGSDLSYEAFVDGEIYRETGNVDGQFNGGGQNQVQNLPNGSPGTSYAQCQNQVAIPQNPNRDKDKMMMFILGLVVLVIIAGLIIYAMSQNKNNNKS